MWIVAKLGAKWQDLLQLCGKDSLIIMNTCYAGGIISIPLESEAEFAKQGSSNRHELLAGCGFRSKICLKLSYFTDTLRQELRLKARTEGSFSTAIFHGDSMIRLGKKYHDGANEEFLVPSPVLIDLGRNYRKSHIGLKFFRNPQISVSGGGA